MKTAGQIHHQGLWALHCLHSIRTRWMNKWARKAYETLSFWYPIPKPACPSSWGSMSSWTRLIHPLLPACLHGSLAPNRPPASQSGHPLPYYSPWDLPFNLSHSPVENMQYLPILYKTNSTFRPAMKTLYSLPPTFVNPSPTVLPTDISVSHPQAPAPNVARLCRPKHDHEGDKMNWLLATLLFDPPSYPMQASPKLHLRQVQPAWLFLVLRTSPQHEWLLTSLWSPSRCWKVLLPWKHQNNWKYRKRKLAKALETERSDNKFLC